MTPRQKDLLDYLKSFIEENGYSPSYDDMARAIGISSKSSVHRLVHGLSLHGKIRIIPNHSRSIEIIEPVKLEAAYRINGLKNAIEDIYVMTSSDAIKTFALTALKRYGNETL